MGNKNVRPHEDKRKVHHEVQTILR